MVTVPPIFGALLLLVLLLLLLLDPQPATTRPASATAAHARTLTSLRIQVLSVVDSMRVSSCD
jgi:hypothetical protein